MIGLGSGHITPAFSWVISAAHRDPRFSREAPICLSQAFWLKIPGTELSTVCHWIRFCHLIPPEHGNCPLVLAPGPGEGGGGRFSVPRELGAQGRAVLSFLSPLLTCHSENTYKGSVPFATSARVTHGGPYTPPDARNQGLPLSAVTRWEP